MNQSRSPPPVLPDANSPNLHLAHPTSEETLSISRLTFSSWGEALNIQQFLEESTYLSTVPMAKGGGMTCWILVDEKLPPNQRPILSSCETFKKRALIADPDGHGGLREAFIHGIASVFCDSLFRGRGYAARMMRELSVVLKVWQVKDRECIGSVLYSDIGKRYYAELGWMPLERNFHVELPATKSANLPTVTPLLAEDLETLCKDDEVIIRNVFRNQPPDGKTRVMIIPDLDHMLWHHSKEAFASERLFGKKPQVKGAIAGESPDRIWVIWTHRFYRDPTLDLSSNTLYILRLVVENQGAPSTEDITSAEETDRSKNQLAAMKAVLQRAQDEAVGWNLEKVVLWDPSPLAHCLIVKTRIQHSRVEREIEGIASLWWYGDESGKEKELELVANEKYAWC